MKYSTNGFPRRAITNYDQFRPKIKSGDLLFCSGSGVFSRMIQEVTKSTWSHVGFVMRLDTIDRVMVLESLEPLGVRTVPLSKYLNDYDSRGNPYPGGIAIARHKDFANMANKKSCVGSGSSPSTCSATPMIKMRSSKLPLASGHLTYILPRSTIIS